MVDACIATGTHYLDITGEIAVFEAIHARNEEARNAGVSLIPGVGFDVVPTDAMAAMLAAELEDATHLELAFVGLGASSAGTTKTMVEGLPEGGRARVDGAIQKVPAGWRSREIAFADKTRRAVSIPWGDVSTAYYSTGIGNIITYLAMPPSLETASKWLSRIGPLLALEPVQRGLKRLVELTVEGPDEQARRAGRSEIWGEVRNARGDRVTGTMTTPEGYSFTADSCVEAIKRVLAGVDAGALTPSMAFGRDFVTGLQGVTIHGIEKH
jgi:saccharopine dehydrogenase (NAD+, L-lysine-forming)